MVDAAIFLSSPVGLAPLLQNTGHQAVKPRLFEQQCQIAKVGERISINQLFSR